MGKVLVIGNADFSDVAIKKVDFLKGGYIKITTSIERASDLIGGEGFYTIGETATITASSNERFLFVKWSDGVTDATRTINITSEGDLYFHAEYVLRITHNDFVWGNGGITGVGRSTNKLNDAATTVTKMIHTLSECKFMISQDFEEDFTIKCYGILTYKPVIGATYPSGTYYGSYNKPILESESERYLQICVGNTKDVSFTSDLSQLSEILLVAGEYELVS